jgi:peroxiredoxin
MCSHRQLWTLLAAASLAAACLGCGNGQTANGPEQPNGPSGDNGTGQVTPNDNPAIPVDPPHVNDPPPPPTIPKVAMTEELLATCLVRVDDTMPEAELPDLADKLQSLSGLRGQKLTVICLWKSGETDVGELKALDLLADLQELSENYLEKGVHVIGINEGDPPEAVRVCIADAKATFPNLLDPDGAFFEKVATERLPRVYLLDSEGNILWFDLEFSQITRRSLEKGIQVALGEI